jgi:hypothetical protein
MFRAADELKARYDGELWLAELWRDGRIVATQRASMLMTLGWLLNDELPKGGGVVKVIRDGKRKAKR